LIPLIGLHISVLKYVIYYKKLSVNLPTKGTKIGLLRWDEILPDGNEPKEQKKIIESRYLLIVSFWGVTSIYDLLFSI
jgi:hypothetical protein